MQKANPIDVENLIPVKLNWEDVETGDKGNLIGLIDLNEANNWIGSKGDAK